MKRFKFKYIVEYSIGTFKSKMTVNADNKEHARAIATKELKREFDAPFIIKSIKQVK